jgi:hypothetical protein
MNFDSENLQKIFLDLIRPLESDLKGNTFSGDRQVQNQDSESHSIPFSSSETFNPNSGDIPAVQERFQALLKHRLSLEIEQNPPLFPWEDEISEYQSDWISHPIAELRGIHKAGSLWLAQLRRVTLPVPLPESMLGDLLFACESVVQSSLREGAKAVKVAESFFPDHFLQLNQLAGVVMMSPARNGYATLQERLSDLGTDLPSTYQAASATQQMVLSLLAARELIAALTLNAILNQPSTHQWMTEIGALTLQMDYLTHDGDAVLHITGQLPCGGSLSLANGPSLAMAQRPEAGVLSVELADLRPNQPLSLKVQLGNDDAITFAIGLLK